MNLPGVESTLGLAALCSRHLAVGQEAEATLTQDRVTSASSLFYVIQDYMLSALSPCVLACFWYQPEYPQAFYAGWAQYRDTAGYSGRQV